MRPIGSTHTGQPGPCTQLDVGRQQVGEAEAVDGVGVAAAHLHDPVVAGRIGQTADFVARLPDERGIAELVDEFHDDGLSSAGSPNR